MVVNGALTAQVLVVEEGEEWQHSDSNQNDPD